MKGDVRLLLLCAAIALLSRLQCVQAVKYAKTGFYFDNGLGQTELGVLNPEEEENLRETFLTLLGLSHAPKEGPKRINVDQMRGNGTVPHFMQHIYKALTTDNSDSGELKQTVSEEDLTANLFKITPQDAQTIIESDVIMSFANHGHQEELQWTQLFWFDTAELPNPQEEELMRAELRLFKGPADEHLQAEETFHVRCYQLVQGSTGKQNILDTAQVKFGDEGWLSLDITRAVREWQFDYHKNQGLMVEFVRSGKQLHPVAVGMNTNREEHPDKESFMVAYFKNKEDAVWRHYRQKRDAEEASGTGEPCLHMRGRRATKARPPKSSTRQRKYSALDLDFGYNSWEELGDYYGGQHKNKHCQRRMFRVSFRELGWQDWILAPNDYEAWYCHGECSFPLGSHMNATNHAIVQTLVHLMNISEVPKPKCAPTDLAAISVLYFDESSNVILKKYRNMAVKSCGCH